MTICLLLRSSCGMAPFIPHSWLMVTLLWLLKLYLTGHNKRGNSHNGIQQPLLHTAAFLQTTIAQLFQCCRKGAYDPLQLLFDSG